MTNQTVLVVGGAGYIGSHVNKLLNDSGYRTVILDNLSTGHQAAVTRGHFIKGEMGDAALLDQIFQQHRVSAVMHFAACIDVGESVTHPYEYYRNNVCNTLSLLNAMKRNHIKIFIFSSTAAIFGIPQQTLLTEDHPCNPINPYGSSKLMVEKILDDFDHAYGIRSCSLRYFNAAGGDPEKEIKNHKQRESNLIPVILRNLKKGNPQVTIFGTDYPTPDGTCIRDYIHIMDLGRAHIAAMEQLWEGKASSCYNLGNGNGFSVRQVIEAVKQVTGMPIHPIEGARRPGDPPVLLADSKKAKQELGWEIRYPELKTMVAHAWSALGS